MTSVWRQAALQPAVRLKVIAASWSAAEQHICESTEQSGPREQSSLSMMEDLAPSQRIEPLVQVSLSSKLSSGRGWNRKSTTTDGVQPSLYVHISSTWRSGVGM